MKNDKGRPEFGKQYALTGKTGTASIAAGNTWAESEVTSKGDIDATLTIIDRLAAKSCVRENRSDKKGGEYVPLKYKKPGVYHGFLSDWDGDCRSEFRYALVGAGFKQGMYEASYFWRVSNGRVSVEYVEGDVYATIV